ncbi:hypothetical protein BSLG_004139 [Batrachochytrium salamandrivorans]|nr:hypothetical protein BSLG_004139 [Batrachochytrium salamandrivorans]
MSRIVIVGGGLAGLSAAHTVLERGGCVVLLDKNAFLGRHNSLVCVSCLSSVTLAGNSTKATSGINGAGTSTQIKAGIPDNSQIFYEDSAKSARAEIVPELTKVLTYQSGAAVEWIQDKFKVDLSLISRLGGHSQPRTHRGTEQFPGMTITYALMEGLEDTARSSPATAQVIKKANVTKLIMEGSTVVGVEYVKGNQTFKEMGPVILATGGYAADFSETSLLKKYRPELWDLPTTNGDHCTGDGIKMTTAIGGNTIHMDKVQVHPTGLVDPNEPDAKVKFLAAEALRGVGGLLSMPMEIVLLTSLVTEITSLHYMGRGLMKHYKSAAAMSQDTGMPLKNLESTFSTYNNIAKTKNDPFGKKFFHNTPLVPDDEYWVAVVCPVLHFTMGGVQINDKSNVLGANGVIPGLFACGEMAGGVHGANRLGGSSLLGCVVYGRVAGATAASYLMNQFSAQRRLGAVAGHLSTVPVTISIAGVNVTVTHGNIAANTSAFSGSESTSGASSGSTPPVAAAPATAAAESTSKNHEFSLTDISKHNKDSDCWVVVNGQVLDVTGF